MATWIEGKLTKNLRRAVDQSTERLLTLTEGFAQHEGLNRRQRTVTRFLDAFPFNIFFVFSFFALILFGASQLITRTVGTASLSDAQKNDLAARRAAQLELLQKNSHEGGDPTAYANAVLALEKLDAEKTAPAEAESALMTVISLTIAIGGIFSLPLITSATMKLMSTRLIAAKSVLDREQTPK